MRVLHSMQTRSRPLPINRPLQGRPLKIRPSSDTVRSTSTLMYEAQRSGGRRGKVTGRIRAGRTIRKHRPYRIVANSRTPFLLSLPPLYISYVFYLL
ncbi:hypothetical protein K523DRAFT_10616 [Schizophyllum commune Tattone D]|nr:hypothetical protein K523DRAFT_10616 [Schizophyllum commune Tattone D]